jgi:signal transduction histidine kinase/HAMP domain-containing protein
MTGFTSLRMRLAGVVLLAIAPAWVLMYFIHLPLTGFVVGLIALVAAWYGGEHFVLRQVRWLSRAAERLADGDLSTRTGLAHERGEFGQVARTFDTMAATLQRRVEEREEGEKTLLQRSLQQTVLGALGQFAFTAKDMPALFDQAVMLITQTLEVEFCHVLEVQEDEGLLMSAGAGWREGWVGANVAFEAGDQMRFVMEAGEPVVISDLPSETRFWPAQFLVEHNVASGVCVPLGSKGRPFGILGAYTSRQRRFTEEEVHFLLSAATLVAMAIERHRSEAEMRNLANFAQLNPNPAMELAGSGAISYFNDAALDLSESMGHNHPREILPQNIHEILQTCLSTRQSRRRHETSMNGRTLSWSFHPVAGRELVHAYVEDITERLNLEAQFRQSQKMESVGQLAAGVAHDFNNMLTVVQGHSGMLMTKPTLPTELLDPVQAIYFAAERAAGLTRQLLMFSRKNVMQPRNLDLREVVAQISRLLTRLLGETIKLEINSPAFMPLVEGDSGMIEQVLMNLAVNARDAMAKGGKLTISASPVDIGSWYVSTHPDSYEGSFVCLRITDTGCGMDALTLGRIFEPFFTTKEVGKGTGLGLATVYGIVKQHKGWIEVTSELGVGTTFNTFFPATSEFVTHVPTRSPSEVVVPEGQETILVVEDEPLLRDLANAILTNCGYQVLEAATGVEALNVWDRHEGRIQLLLTDMIMPEGMSGMELAQRLVTVRPSLKIIIASGYSMDELDNDFMRERNARFIQKPYTHITLPQAVRECLDN